MAKRDWEDEWDIYVRDRCACVYCGFRGDELLKWRQLCLDHIIPSSVGGTDDQMNKTVACNYCNLMKRDYDPSEGQVKVAPTEEVRGTLIEKAKAHIPTAITQSYGHDSAEEEIDFRQMMAEITALSRPRVTL